MTVPNTITAKGLVKYLKDLNPTIDTGDPIIQDLVVNFGTNIVTEVQTRVANLNSRFTNAFLNQLTDNELDIYAYNSHGLIREPGVAVTGFVYAMFTAPADSGDAVFSTNTIVGTSDGVWRYATTEPIFISASSLPSFYNPVRNSYEVRIPVRAMKTGISYRAAAYRINTIQSTLNFNVKIENREPFVTGSDPETREAFINRINLAKAGFDLNTMSGLRDSLLSNITGLQDVMFSHSIGHRNAYDIFYIGYQPVAEVLEYSVVNTTNREIKFDPSKAPIRYVDGVVVDGVNISPDRFRYTSTKVILHSSVALTSSTVVFVSYQYNQINSALKGYLESNLDLPGGEWNVREGIPDFVKVKIKLKPQSFLTLPEVSSLVSDTVYQYLNPNQFIVGIQASKIRNLILDAHNYVLDCQVSVNDMPFYDFELGHYPILTSDNLEIGLM